MLPLRFPWLWLALGWLLVVGVCVGSLIPGDMLPTISVRDKILHAGSYFLLMTWFAGLYSRRHHAVIAAVLLALGIALDLVQGGTATRTFDPPIFLRTRSVYCSAWYWRFGFWKGGASD